MEVVFDADTVARLSDAMYSTAGGNLESGLPPDLFARAAALLRRHGLAESAARRLKPWAAYTTLSLPPNQQAPPLDLVLMLDADARGIPVTGLETLDEQIGVFESLGASEQVELLTLTVCHYERFQREIDEMIEHYVANDLRAIMAMAVRYSTPLQDRFMDALLRRRNHRMAERMRPLIDAGGAFIAIGALHLPGAEGVLALLEQAGYRVTRVP